VRVKAGLSAVRDELQAVVRGENEESSLVVSWCAYYGDGFGHQQLVGAMGVQVDARQERGLRGVGVYPSDRDQVVLVLEVEDFFFVHGGARVGGAFLFWEDHVGYDQFVLFLQGSSINTEKFKEQYDQRKFLRFYYSSLSKTKSA
jgi:hypothetical protein